MCMTNSMVLIKNNLYKALIIISIILFFVYVNKNLDKKPASTEIKMASSTIYAQIADSDTERSLGLSYTKELGKNAGMLFIFDQIGSKNFWMRDMNYDLDIIWLDENKQVTGFFENAKRESYNKLNPSSSKVFHSPEQTKYVLELNAGSIKELKIKVSDILDFKY